MTKLREGFTTGSCAAAAALACCLREDTRDLDGVTDGLWCICEESSWVISAHNVNPVPGAPAAREVPLPDPDAEAVRHRIILRGDIPSPVNLGSGCPFASRCPRARSQCREQMPELKEVSPGHFAACHEAG